MLIPFHKLFLYDDHLLFRLASDGKEGRVVLTQNRTSQQPPMRRCNVSLIHMHGYKLR